MEDKSKNKQQIDGDSLEMVSEGLSQLRRELAHNGVIDDTITDYGILQCASYLVNLFSKTPQFSSIEYDFECSQGLKRPPPPPPEPTWEEKIEAWKLDMNSYYKSSYWRGIRKKLLDYGAICSICNSDNDLVVHHLNYDNIGNEIEEDLEVLCRSCHSIYYMRERK